MCQILLSSCVDSSDHLYWTPLFDAPEMDTFSSAHGVYEVPGSVSLLSLTIPEQSSTLHPAVPCRSARIHLIGSTYEYFYCRRYRLCECISPYSDCPAIRIFITLSN